MGRAVPLGQRGRGGAAGKLPSLRRGTGAIVITSSSGVQESLEGGDIDNGLFTYSIITGLTGYRCDRNKDKKVQVSELMKWVFDEVVRLAKKTEHVQTPTMRRENIEFDYVIY